MMEEYLAQFAQKINELDTSVDLLVRYMNLMWVAFLTSTLMFTNLVTGIIVYLRCRKGQ